MYSLQQLKALPTIGDSHFDNLKVETEVMRVWLSRCDVTDGEPYPNKVTIEERVNGSWEITNIYQAK
jgi:hypothetical protein